MLQIGYKNFEMLFKKSFKIGEKKVKKGSKISLKKG